MLSTGEYHARDGLFFRRSNGKVYIRACDSPEVEADELFTVELTQSEWESVVRAMDRR